MGSNQQVVASSSGFSQSGSSIVFSSSSISQSGSSNIFSTAGSSQSSSSSNPPPRKIARVQPTPHIVRPIPTKPAAPAAPGQLSSSAVTPSPKSSPAAGKDPMSALNSLSKNLLASPVSDLSLSRPQELQTYHQSSHLIKHDVPSNWSSITPKHEVIDVDSGPSSPASSVWGDHDYCSSPEPEPTKNIKKLKKSLQGVNITTKASKTNSIQFVLQRNSDDNYNINQVTVKDGSKSRSSIDAKTANKALKIKSRKERVKKFKNSDSFLVPLDSRGRVIEAQNTFVNEQEVDNNTHDDDNKNDDDESERKVPITDPYIMFKISSDDGGINLEGGNITHLWRKVFDAVSDARSAHKMESLSCLSLGPSGEDMLGLTHTALRYLLEQAPGASKVSGYTWKHQPEPPKPAPVKENPSGSARTEAWSGERRPHDMFAWLASRYRRKPHPNVGFKLPPEIAAEAHLMEGNNRRATSLDLPMAMRYRQLAKNAREAVGVYASGIHGRGLFCKREISAGEMVIEYAGEQIRSILTDYREKFYDQKGIGCYMFKVDDDVVIDATMRGNAARFINHSCEPNCYSKIVDILGSKHIIIFAMRKIFPGEELTYDYKFPREDDKIECHCGARKCKKYMN